MAAALLQEDETRQLLQALCPGERTEATGQLPPNDRMLWEQERQEQGGALPNNFEERITAFNALDNSAKQRFTEQAARLQQDYEAKCRTYDAAVEEFWDSLLDTDNLRYPATGKPKPDVNFAIQESSMFLDWSKVGMVDLVLATKGGEGWMNGLVAECNFVGILPNFCDGMCFWEDVPKHYYTLPTDEDSDDDSDEEEDFVTSIPFPPAHFGDWLNTVRRELHKVEWGAVQEFNQDDDDCRLFFFHEMRTAPARVRRWQSGGGGHRLEYWYTLEEDTDYIILQTDGGKLLTVGVIGCHPFLVCNLLNFGNSDGSAGRIGQARGIHKLSTEASAVVEVALEAAVQTLYHQIH